MLRVTMIISRRNCFLASVENCVRMDIVDISSCASLEAKKLNS
jgi:hypothetical protein